MFSMQTDQSHPHYPTEILNKNPLHYAKHTILNKYRRKIQACSPTQILLAENLGTIYQETVPHFSIYKRKPTLEILLLIENLRMLRQQGLVCLGRQFCGMLVKSISTPDSSTMWSEAGRLPCLYFWCMHPYIQ